MTAALRKLAAFHGLIPVLPRRSEFEAAARRNQIHALRLAAHLQQLLARLESAGVPVLVLKGLPLAKRLYGDIAARKAGDRDLWIPEEAVDDVHELLVAADHAGKTGYERLGHHDRRRYRRHRFHIGYFHEEPDAPPIAEALDRAAGLGLHRPVIAGLTLANEFLDLELPGYVPQPDRATRRLAVSPNSAASSC